MTKRIKRLLIVLVVVSAALLLVLVVRLTHPAARVESSSISATTIAQPAATTRPTVTTSAPATTRVSSEPVVPPTTTSLTPIALPSTTGRLTPESVVGENVQKAAAQLRAEGFHVTLQCVEPAPYDQVVGWSGGGFGPTLYFGSDAGLNCPVWHGADQFGQPLP